MLLSIDVGIKNLAMCLMDPGTKKIHEWEVAGVPPQSTDGLFRSLKKHIDGLLNGVIRSYTSSVVTESESDTDSSSLTLGVGATGSGSISAMFAIYQRIVSAFYMKIVIVALLLVIIMILLMRQRRGPPPPPMWERPENRPIGPMWGPTPAWHGRGHTEI